MGSATVGFLASSRSNRASAGPSITYDYFVSRASNGRMTRARSLKIIHYEKELERQTSKGCHSDFCVVLLFLL